MPFGPRNAPAVFQSMMNRTLGDALYHYALVYLDDIIVWGSTVEEVLQRTKTIISKLEANGLILSGLKSEFGLQKVKLLGKTVCNGIMYPGIDKVQGLKSIKKPKTVSDVRSLYGLLSHYR